MSKKYILHATSLAKLSTGDSGPNNEIVRVHNRHMKHFSRWMPVTITNMENGQWTIRYIIGAGGLKGLTLQSLGLDYDAQYELGIKDRHNANISLEKASFWQKQKWLLRTQNLHNRYGNYWGVLGTILGIISLFDMFWG